MYLDTIVHKSSYIVHQLLTLPCKSQAQSDLKKVNNSFIYLNEFEPLVSGKYHLAMPSLQTLI